MKNSLSSHKLIYISILICLVILLSIIQVYLFDEYMLIYWGGNILILGTFGVDLDFSKSNIAEFFSYLKAGYMFSFVISLLSLI